MTEEAFARIVHECADRGRESLGTPERPPLHVVVDEVEGVPPRPEPLIDGNLLRLSRADYRDLRVRLLRRASANAL